MDDKVKGLQLLTSTILNNTCHKDYTRVTTLAKQYFDIFTGEGIDTYLKQFTGREDDRMFEQRKKIYQSTIPATVENILSTFNKPLRSNRIYSSVEHPSSPARDEIMDRMRNFWQGESESGVDAYLRNRWIALDTYDPNAFIAVEFADFNAATEKTYPFPLEYSSTEAVNYLYKNGVLDWIIMKQACTYRIDAEDPKKTAGGSRFVMYLENWALVLTQVDVKKRISAIGNESLPFIEIKDDKGKVVSVFTYAEFNTKAGQIPLAKAGHKLDPVTNNRTCVSILHAALGYFKKEIKTGSEFDLTMALHAFPQKLQYGRRCEGDREKGIICTNGKTPNGGVCPSCNGSMVQPIHKSAQDIILIAPPKDGQPALDLEKALVYKSPPIDLIKFQEEYLDTLTEKAIGAVFAAQSVQKSTIEKSATEMDYSYDNVYDTLDPFATKYSYLWRFFVHLVAVYTDNLSDSLVIYHAFPKDFKLKSVATLLAEAKTASESGLSQHAIDAINNDILEALYADDQDTLTKIKVKNRFAPFSGKSKEELQSIMMSGDILPYYKTLYLYFDVIFDEIDNELGDQFYLMTYANQKAEVESRVKVITDQIADNAAKSFLSFSTAIKNGQQKAPEAAPAG